MAELRLSVQGAVGNVIVCNPERMNALTLEMWRALPRLLAALDADPAVRVIVLRGEGERAFAAGADISEFDSRRDEALARAEYDRALEEALAAPGRTSKPVVASIRGVCMGGGLGLAAACDLRIAADDALFRMPAARLGLGYSADGVRRFLTLLGAAATCDLFFTARRFDAAEALRLGFVSRVVPAQRLEPETAALCAQIAENAPLTIAAVKATVRELLRDPEQRDLARVSSLIEGCFRSEDYREGRRAFLEKRKPVFRGR